METNQTAMNWNAYLGPLSACSFFVPVLLIGCTGLYANKSLLLLGLYCLLHSLYGMADQAFWPLSVQAKTAFASVTNYLDAPLMLLVLLLFCHSTYKRKALSMVAGIYVVYEIGIATYWGLKPSSTLFVCGPGLLLVFGYGFYFFRVQLRQTIQYGKGLGRTLLAAAILFVYGCFCIIYCFYYLLEVSQVEDVFLLYHLASLIFCLLLSFGLLQLNRQHKKIKQLQLVRKELAQFY